MSGPVRFAALVCVLIGAWFAGSPGTFGAVHPFDPSFHPIITDHKRQHLWQWFRTSGARCIHRREGSWRDPNPPYEGGMQMSRDFQRAYGRHYGKNISYVRRWGTADDWPVWAQIHATRHAHAHRGFNPWPNTARACGLL